MRSAALVLRVPLLTACIPAPYGPYYRPSYPGRSATLIKEYCGGEAGPPSILRFDIAHGVTLTVSTAKSNADRGSKDVPLTIAVTVPSATTVQFVSDDLRISDTPAGEGHKVVTTLQVAAWVPMGKKDAVDIDRIGPVTSQVVRKFIQDHPGHAVSEARIDFSAGDATFHPETISLQLPGLSANGVSIAIPPLKLVANAQDTGWWKYETLEHQQARQERYARCVRETPQRHCKNILQFIDEGFRLDTGGFEVSGRLAMAHFTQEPKLSGRLNIASRSVEPWQFTTNEIRADDIRTSEANHHFFDQFAVFFGWYAVPFTTAVKGVHSGPVGSTTLRITTRLGEKHPSKHYIRLPPLRINGQEHVLKPIELELKRFDGGIEPFNC